jgi:2-desacetyl-2-hydroxyethyl bacteriochlorophyllide A dehydrogenase
VKAAYYEAPRLVDVRETRDPEPGDGDVVVRVHACGICGTDQHIFEGKLASPYPFIGGHELVGEVTEGGGGVDDDVRVGDRVAVDPNIFCGACFFCQRGQVNHCQRWKAIGVTRDGGFADYVIAPATNIYPIPDMPYETAAFIEPLSCVVYAVRRIDVPLGANALVYGAGPIGLLMLQVLMHGGASAVACIDLKQDKLDVARGLGANDTVIAGPAADAELSELSPLGFDVVVDCTGVPTVVEHMPTQARNNGTLLYFGVSPPEARVEISPYEIYRKDLAVYGSFAQRFSFHDAMTLLQSGAVEVEPLLTRRFPIEQFAEALELAFSGEALKVQIQPG